MPKIWKQRPSASSLGGQIAWDMLANCRPRQKIVELWYAPEMEDGAWCAKYDNGECLDIDVLVTRHEVNKRKSLKFHFEMGRNAARVGAVALQEDRALIITSATSPEDLAEFERGVALGLSERISRLSFVVKSSNLRKLAEINRFGLAVTAEPGTDLPEVDGTPEQVATYKALAAGPGVLVEDTSLDVEGFDAGVNIRWLLENLTKRVRESGTTPKAVWRVMLAVHDGKEMFVAKAEVPGRMVAEPRGAGFSFDAYFVPDEHEQTLGEMEAAGTKDLVSARKAAVQNLLSGHCSAVPLSDIPEWTGPYQAN
jgi:inosine/xanthosine triphosphate pyrophosphatase family protein